MIQVQETLKICAGMNQQKRNDDREAGNPIESIFFLLSVCLLNAAQLSLPR